MDETRSKDLHLQDAAMVLTRNNQDQVTLEVVPMSTSPPKIVDSIGLTVTELAGTRITEWPDHNPYGSVIGFDLTTGEVKARSTEDDWVPSGTWTPMFTIGHAEGNRLTLTPWATKETASVA